MVGQPAGGAPTSIQPMLATLGQLPADETGWAFEFKWDGVRAVCYLEAGRDARFSSRRDKDLTAGVPALQPDQSAWERLAGHLPAVLDGEIVAFDEHGVPRFQALQARHANPATPIAYVVFDVLCLAGRLLVDEPYSERRRVLESLRLGEIPNWSVSPSFEGGGRAVFETSGERGLEGVMAKRADSRYLPGRRSPAWLKIKHTTSGTFVVGGFTSGSGSREGTIGALLLGVEEAGGLRYVGKVGSGLGTQELRGLEAILRGLVLEEPPFGSTVPRADSRGATWVEPAISGKVKFTEWTAAGRLRQPVWLGVAPRTPQP
ncbi:MAG: non-homologous end-joining DNA ligase [Acidimicrobiales bacterium]